MAHGFVSYDAESKLLVSGQLLLPLGPAEFAAIAALWLVPREFTAERFTSG